MYCTSIKILQVCNISEIIICELKETGTMRKDISVNKLYFKIIKEIGECDIFDLSNHIYDTPHT